MKNNFNLNKYAQNKKWHTREIAITTKDPQILMEILRRGKDDYVSILASENPNCPPEALTEVLKRGKNDFVSQYAASNLNCPPEALAEVLRRGKDNSVSCFAARNPNCPKEMLIEILKREKDDDVSQFAAQNKNCPKEILTDILKKEKNDKVSLYAAKNPNCPKEILVEILKRGKDNDVSRNAACNKNCPLEEKIKWMQVTGKIEKEDESKGHIIEYEKTSPEDDLSDLKKLIGSSFNLKKYAQKKNWYTVEIARTTKDPKILVDILKRGEDDLVSRAAARNLNCPPETLAEVLRRENDWVSCCAARNPNCPKEILIEVLRREKDDYVSRNAAKNPNCPPEILIEVLKRGKNDEVSYFAAENPNCSLEAKIKWMQVTGRIEKEDPNKHIIEYEDKKDDDLSDLKKLLGSNFNLKKYAQNEEWYNIKVARDTHDPQILINILRKGNDDNVSRKAALNPNCPKEILEEILEREDNDKVSRCAVRNINCPPEILEKVLRRGNNDSVSYWSSLNPNCPKEILVEILRKGKDDNVSCGAAENINCPPEVLEEVLRRGKDDEVSEYAAENPNCPDEAKIKWMQLTGKIEKEDESKGHIIEYEKTSPEDDLSDLKKLIGNSFNLKKYSNKNKLEEGRIYNKREMINLGADGSLSDAIFLNIPIKDIIGREPIPSSYVDENGIERQFIDKKEIIVPIEVEYENGEYVLYGGNHRLRQAEINGDEYIKAFVHCHNIEDYNKILL